MAVEIKQGSQPVTSRRWNWSIKVEGPAEELDELESVTYELHPTFKDPIRLIDDRESGFELTGTAWGEFMVHVTLRRKDGSSEERNHWLRLAPGAPQKDEKIVSRALFKSEAPTVFLSAGMADLDQANKLKDALDKLGIVTLTHSDINTGADWQSELHSMLEKADVGVALLSSEASHRVQSEVAELRGWQKPVVPVMYGNEAEVPTSMQDLKGIRIAADDDFEQVANKVAQVLPTFVK